MSNLLGQLENNEAILLMYLAGELSGEDRAEVEQLLADDGSLRALLTELTDLQSDVTGVLAKSDGQLILPRRDAAVRRVSRAMATAQAGARVPAATTELGRPTLRIPWWAYPIAAAAALVVAVVMLTDRPNVKIAGLGSTAPTVVTDPDGPGSGGGGDFALAEVDTGAGSVDPSVAALQGVADSIADLRTPEENLLAQGLLLQE
jgi:anti-sigma-K factor RskA